MASFYAWPYTFSLSNISYKSQKFLFSIWVAEPSTFDFDRWSFLPLDPCELPPATWAGALRFGRFFEADEAEVVLAIVRSYSFDNLFTADRTWVFSLFDVFHDLFLLLHVDGVEHCLVLSKLSEELFLLQSHISHLLLAFIRHFAFLQKLLEGLAFVVQVHIAFFAGLEHFFFQFFDLLGLL